MITLPKLMLLDYGIIGLSIVVLSATGSGRKGWVPTAKVNKGLDRLAKVLFGVLVALAWVFTLSEVWRLLVAVAVGALVYATYLERKFVVLLAALGINVVANASMMIREVDTLVLIAFKAGVYVAAFVLLIRTLVPRSVKEPNG